MGIDLENVEPHDLDTLFFPPSSEDVSVWLKGSDETKDLHLNQPVEPNQSTEEKFQAPELKF